MLMLIPNDVPVHTDSDCVFAVGLQLSLLRMSALCQHGAFLPLQVSHISANGKHAGRKSGTGL